MLPMQSKDHHMDSTRASELYVQAFLQSRRPCLLLDDAFQVIEANQQATSQLALGEGVSLQGQRFADLFANGAVLQPQWAQLRAGQEEEIQLIGHLKDKAHDTGLVIAMERFVLQSNAFYVVRLTDPSSSFQLKQALQESETLLKSIISHAVDGIITIDGRGQVQSVNPAAAHLFGYEPEEVIGHNVSMLMPEPDRSAHDSYIDNYHQTGIGKIIGVGREVRGRRKDGTLFPFWLSISKVPFQDKDVFTGIIHDISELKQAELKLRRYADELERSNRELQDFAYVSSHDLQEPLRKIQAFGSRIQDREGEKLSEKSQDFLARMLNASERMQRLINDLLSYSRVSTQGNPFQQIDLAGVVDGVLNDLEYLFERTGAKIEVDPLPHMEADPIQMRQLFQNLLINAIKFQQPDQIPVLKIQCTEIRFDNSLRTKGIEIQVIDNGIGFDARYAEKIFTIFQRLEGQKYQGSGIGLAICKRIVQRHHGYIAAQSAGPNQGAQIIVRLPLTQEG